MWKDSSVAINKYLADEIRAGLPVEFMRMQKRPLPPVDILELWYGHADMNTGKRTTTTYGALDAFFPAILALSGDLDRASRLQYSSYVLWKKQGIEPEEFNYTKREVVSPDYPLRPEIVESTYYLHHYAMLGEPQSSRSFRRGTRPSAAQVPPLNESKIRTDAEHYQQMGEMMFRDFVKYCRTDEGYAALKSVVTKEQADSMQSFLFAETFKYFYLLFAPPKTLDFDKVIFNTEAHPVRRAS